MGRAFADGFARVSDVINAPMAIRPRDANQFGQRLHGAPAAWVRRHHFTTIPALPDRRFRFVFRELVRCCNVRGKGEVTNLPRA